MICTIWTWSCALHAGMLLAVQMHNCPSLVRIGSILGYIWASQAARSCTACRCRMPADVWQSLDTWPSSVKTGRVPTVSRVYLYAGGLACSNCSSSAMCRMTHRRTRPQDEVVALIVATQVLLRGQNAVRTCGTACVGGSTAATALAAPLEPRLGCSLCGDRAAARQQPAGPHHGIGCCNGAYHVLQYGASPG